MILEGLGQTLLLTLLGTVLSVIFGGLLALARLSSSWLLSSLAWGYIWLFRSLPLIVVLIILYNFSYLYDTLSLGIPFTGVTWASYQTINVLGAILHGGGGPDPGAERLYRGDYSRRLSRRRPRAV